MSKTNTQIVKEYIDKVINQKQFDHIFDYCARDCIIHAPPYIGVGIVPDVSDNERVIVVHVASNSPAEGNLLPQDEIVQVADSNRIWESHHELKTSAWGHGVIDTPITVTVRREGEILEIPMKRGRVDGFDLVLSENFETWKKSTLKTWPDLHKDIKLIFGEGDMVACYEINSGTHQEYQQSAIWAECGFYRLQDGKIIEFWSAADGLSQKKQLGFQVQEPELEMAMEE